MWFIHKRIPSSHEKELILTIYNMERLGEYMLSEISQKERQILYVITYMYNLKNKTN